MTTLALTSLEILKITNRHYEGQIKSSYTFFIVGQYFFYLVDYFALQSSRIFEDVLPNSNSAKAWIFATLRDVNKLKTGNMRNSKKKSFDSPQPQNLCNIPDNPLINQVFWNLPPSGWIKIIIEGSIKEAASHARCSGTFQTCQNSLKDVIKYTSGFACFRSTNHGYHYGY